VKFINISLLFIAFFLFSCTDNKNNYFQITKNDKSNKDYILMPLTGAEKILLLDPEFKIKKEWNLDANRVRLLPNCNLLIIHGSKWGMKQDKWKPLRDRVVEYNWAGEKVWEYIDGETVHHDVQRTKNETTIFPVRVKVPIEYKNKINNLNKRKLEIRSDKILEVSKDKKILWQWLAHKHLDLNSCGKRKCSDLRNTGELSDWTHINTVIPIPENKWFDKGDLRFKPGNIMILPRNWWSVLIIDKETKKIAWEYQGDSKSGLSGGHEAHMIPKGFPGEGNVLIFDNGRTLHKGESYIIEVNPISKEIVWKYEAGKDFFSNSAGSVQRLKNGNTFISEDVGGQRIFEVNKNSKILFDIKSNYRLSRTKKYPVNFCKNLK